MANSNIVKENLFKESVSEIFHENSKQARSDFLFIERIIAAMYDPRIQRVLATSHKRYPSATTIKLPSEFPIAKKDFDNSILTRRSTREFSNEKLAISEISKLLHFANGITNVMDMHGGNLKQFFRSTPSAGAIYSIEVYLIVLGADELSPGIYHYNPIDNNVEILSTEKTHKQLADDLVRITYTEEIKNASVIFVLTGIPSKTKFKYGERGYRFMLMEAGHVSQNILLASNSLDMASFPIGGFVDDELNELLGLDGLEEVALYLIAVGKLVSNEEVEFHDDERYEPESDL